MEVFGHDLAFLPLPVALQPEDWQLLQKASGVLLPRTLVESCSIILSDRTKFNLQSPTPIEVRLRAMFFLIHVMQHQSSEYRMIIRMDPSLTIRGWQPLDRKLAAMTSRIIKTMCLKPCLGLHLVLCHQSKNTTTAGFLRILLIEPLLKVSSWFRLFKIHVHLGTEDLLASCSGIEMQNLPTEMGGKWDREKEWPRWLWLTRQSTSEHPASFDDIMDGLLAEELSFASADAGQNGGTILPRIPSPDLKAARSFWPIQDYVSNPRIEGLMHENEDQALVWDGTASDGTLIHNSTRDRGTQEDFPPPWKETRDAASVADFLPAVDNHDFQLVGDVSGSPHDLLATMRRETTDPLPDMITKCQRGGNEQPNAVVVLNGIDACETERTVKEDGFRFDLSLDDASKGTAVHYKIDELSDAAFRVQAGIDADVAVPREPALTFDGEERHDGFSAGRLAGTPYQGCLEPVSLRSTQSSKREQIPISMGRRGDSGISCQLPGVRLGVLRRVEGKLKRVPKKRRYRKTRLRRSVPPAARFVAAHGDSHDSSSAKEPTRQSAQLAVDSLGATTHEKCTKENDTRPPPVFTAEGVPNSQFSDYVDEKVSWVLEERRRRRAAYALRLLHAKRKRQRQQSRVPGRLPLTESIYSTP